MPAERAPVNEKRPASRHLEFTAIEELTIVPFLGAAQTLLPGR
jgi:hypothetical protein